MSVLGSAGWWKVKGEGSMWGEENVMSLQVKDEFLVNAKGIHNNNSGLAWVEIILILKFFML